MSTHRFTLTGWKAVAVVAAVVAFGGFRFATAHASLDTEGREVLQRWISADIQRALLADATLSVAEQGQALLDAGEVRIRSLTGRGPADDIVVRVELEPDDAYPEGTETTRYYRMEYSSLTGWLAPRDATVASYYLAMF